MKIVSTIEARMGSTRLPGKSMKRIMDKPMLELMIERVKKATLIDEIVIATSENPKDDVIELLAKRLNVGCFRGSEDDVLDRVLKAAKAYKADHIVELWGDSPLIDPEIIDEMIKYYLDNEFDCAGTTIPTLKKTFPLGLSALIFPTNILEEVSQITQDPVDRENVSNYIYEHPTKYKIGSLPCPPEFNYPEMRLTVDELADFELVKNIFERLTPINPDFKTIDIIKFLDSNPEIKNINIHVKQKKLIHMKPVKETTFNINDLPRFSPWPARLLGLELWGQRHKTTQEIVREFEYEKWGPLLARVREVKREVSVDEVDEWVQKEITDTLCSIEGRLELLSAKEARRQYRTLIGDLLKAYLPASALVELGAGYGSIILGLAKQGPFAGMRFMAGEYTVSGIKLIRRLAQAQGTAIEVAHCDFTSFRVADFAIPENALIFTSYATPYVPKLSADFVKALSAYHPRAVVHIEPCYEHCDCNTLLGLMRRRYISVNDYNTNLVTLLRDQQDHGMIKILDERPAVFGANPLLAASVLVWVPLPLD